MLTEHINRNDCLYIENIIAARQKQAYAYVHLNNFASEVITELTLINELRNHFTKVLGLNEPNKDGQKLTGQITFNPHKIISGEVIVVRDKSELQEKSQNIDGKIIVATQTTPHYIPHLKNILAIVTDEGGLTCHAAIVAREMKKPCIVGTRVATRTLADGDKIEILPDEGIVRVIQQANK